MEINKKLKIFSVTIAILAIILSVITTVYKPEIRSQGKTPEEIAIELEEQQKLDTVMADIRKTLQVNDICDSYIKLCSDTLDVNEAIKAKKAELLSEAQNLKTKAKEFGIKTAETIYQARIKCPNIKIYQSDFRVYQKYSNMLYNLLLEYTDRIERFSIDECFLDMTNYLMKRSLMEVAQEIHVRVKNELGFTVNIGVANNKLLAKMASDFAKPDKIHTLYINEIKQKMWPLSVSELFMLGRRTVPKLQNMQIRTIGDLANTNKEVMVKKFGKHGLQMWEYANGIDESEVRYLPEKPKGIGNSITLPENISEIEKLEEILLSLSEHVTYRLRKYKMKAKVVNIQLRTKKFPVSLGMQRLQEEKLIMQ